MLHTVSLSKGELHQKERLLLRSRLLLTREAKHFAVASPLKVCISLEAGLTSGQEGVPLFPRNILNETENVDWAIKPHHNKPAGHVLSKWLLNFWGRGKYNQHSHNQKFYLCPKSFPISSSACYEQRKN